MKNKRRALVIGAAGQDGAYLCRLLSRMNYQVIGTSRTPESNKKNLEQLGIKNEIKICKMQPEKIHSVRKVFEGLNPQEIYYLAGQTSVARSFSFPATALEGITLGLLNVLEVMKVCCPDARLFHASSSEIFGETDGAPATIATEQNPKSPYAIAKSAASSLVKIYRESHGMWLSNGILFNHESPLRARGFVTEKIVSGAHEIYLGRTDKLTLGSLDVARDWGWAPEYVGAMQLMLGHNAPLDAIIATGRTVSLNYFVEKVFDYFGLNSRKFVYSDASIERPSDIKFSAADPSKTYQALGWQAERDVDFVIEALCKARLKG